MRTSNICMHHEYIDDFISSLKSIMKADMLEKFKTAKFYGLEINSLTDIGICQNFMLYIWSVVEGKVFSSFLNLVQLQEAALQRKSMTKFEWYWKRKIHL